MAIINLNVVISLVTLLKHPTTRSPLISEARDQGLGCLAKFSPRPATLRTPRDRAQLASQGTIVETSHLL